MDTIIVRPGNTQEAQEVLAALRKMNVEAEFHAGFVEPVFEKPSDEEILATKFV